MKAPCPPETGDQVNPLVAVTKTGPSDVSRGPLQEQWGSGAWRRGCDVDAHQLGWGREMVLGGKRRSTTTTRSHPLAGVRQRERSGPQAGRGWGVFS